MRFCSALLTLAILTFPHVASAGIDCTATRERLLLENQLKDETDDNLQLVLRQNVYQLVVREAECLERWVRRAEKDGAYHILVDARTQLQNLVEVSGETGVKSQLQKMIAKVDASDMMIGRLSPAAGGEAVEANELGKDTWIATGDGDVSYQRLGRINE